MFILDLETLDVESTAIVLSLAVTHVTDNTNDYKSMIDNSIMLKFKASEQAKKGRTHDKDTCRWWDRQSEIVKEASLYPGPNDITVVEGIQILKAWLSKQGHNSNTSIYARGALDAMCLDSLCRTFDVSMPVRYNKFYDVRTVIDLLYDQNNGYVDVDHPTFDVGMVIKHHPVHDCAYDGMMMKYGKK